jgi:hypothetical protein
MTKRRARISCSPATTDLALRKRASSSITWTPSAVKRSTESFGAIAAMTEWTWLCTASKSIFGVTSSMPKSAAWRMAWASLADAIIALDGTQP